MTIQFEISEHVYKCLQKRVELGAASEIDMLVAKGKVVEQEPKTDKYEYHTDHTDCIWYGNDSGCPVTCSQYRDGWNDAMEYIYEEGKGYQPYRRK